MARRGAALPLLPPMLATLGPLPRTEGWAYEFKWDGVRAIVAVESGRVQVVSRNGRDVTASYPELDGIGQLLPDRPAMLDGEIVTLDPNGAPAFGALQQRMHVLKPTPALIARVPVRLYAFDILHLDAKATTQLPYTRRRELLDQRGLDDPVVEVPPYFTDQTGQDLLTAAGEVGLEGVVSKRLDSRYEPGRRASTWVKTPLNQSVEVVIGGWKPGVGRRQGSIGSLLLGMHDHAGRLVYVGHVGTGFTQAMLRDLQRQLHRLRRTTSPFASDVPRQHARDAQWVHPELVAEVQFRTWTPDRRLRHPSWRGLRPDRTPDEIRLP